jgi:DNA-binding NarL/FixJ family response regulator
MITCVRSVHAGHTWLDTPVAHRSLERMLRQTAAFESYAQKLTPQEIAISQLVAKGMSNREIAEQMGIREGTVKLHLHHVYQKLGIGNRIALLLHAREHALV